MAILLFILCGPGLDAGTREIRDPRVLARLPDFLVPEDQSRVHAEESARVRVDLVWYAAAETNQSATLSLHGTNVTVGGWDCATMIEGPRAAVLLEPKKSYILAVTSPAIYSYDIGLQVQPPHRKAPDSEQEIGFPEIYEIYVDGVQRSSISWMDAVWSCTNIAHAYNISVHRRGPALGRVDRYGGGPQYAPGNGTSPTLGPGRAGQPGICDFRWGGSLGHLYDGNRAGWIRLQITNLGPSVLTPRLFSVESEVLGSNTGLTVVTNATGLASVSAPQVWVGVTTNTNSVSLRFQATQAATNAYVTWRVLNPDAATGGTNRVQLIEERGVATSTHELAFDPALLTWSLTSGGAAPLRVEKRRIGVAANGDRLETNEIWGASSNLVYIARETYRPYGWGWELKESVVDPDGAALTTTYEYYTNGSAYAVGKLKSVVFPDGYWESREYQTHTNFWENPTLGIPGVLRFVRRPWGNAPATPWDTSTSDYARTAYYYEEEDPGSPNWNLTSVGDVEDATKGSLTWAGLKWLRAENLGYYSILDPNGEPTVEYNENSVDTLVDPYRPVGDRVLAYNSWAAPGLRDHAVFRARMGGGPADHYYYHWGTYNPATGEFTTNSIGTAWRSSVIHGNNLGVGDAIQFAEGVPLASDYAWWVVQFYAVPNQSWKETTIVSGGALVAQEKWVYTGLDGTGEPQFELIKRLVHTVDSLGHIVATTQYTPLSLGPPMTFTSRGIYNADWRGTNTVDGDLLYAETDETGRQTRFAYDALERLVAVTNIANPNLVTTSEFDAAGRKLREIRKAGDLALTNSWAFDRAGRLVAETNAAGLVTSYAYALGGRQVTKTLPNATTEITLRSLDRRLTSVTGTAVIPQFFGYDLCDPATDPSPEPYTDGIQLWVTNRLGFAGSARWTQRGVDAVDRDVLVQKPAFSGGVHDAWTLYGNWQGVFHDRVVTEQATLCPVRSYSFDALGELAMDGVDASGDGVLDLASVDRVRSAMSGFVKQNGAWFHVTTNFAYLTDNSTAATVTGVRGERLTGFTDANRLVEVYEVDIDGATNTALASVDRAAQRVTLVHTLGASMFAGTNVTLNGLLQSASTPTVAAPMQFYHDALQRPIAVQSPEGFLSGTNFSTYTGQVLAVTNQAGLVTTFQYYPNGHTNAGLVWRETTPAQKTIYRDYGLRGELLHTWGDVPYPEERGYSVYGELVQLKTYRSGGAWASSTNWPGAGAGAETTTWVYQDGSGLLVSKTYPGGSGTVACAYDDAGRLITRTWARGVTTTNEYSAVGNLTAITYSDDTCPVLFEEFNRQGLPTTIIDTLGAHTLAYRPSGVLAQEVWTNGVSLSLTHTFQPAYGVTNVSLLTNGVAALRREVRYEPGTGRFAGVSNTAWGLWAAYSYQPNTDFAATLRLGLGAATNLVTTRGLQFGYRLAGITNTAAGSVLYSQAYTYDGAERRTQATLADGSFLSYAYNDRNELTAAGHYWSDGWPVAGQRFGFAYDAIGNRVSSDAGGTEWGTNLRHASYVANDLNQYTSRTVDRGVDVVGTVTNTATVTVNNLSTSRRGQYFRGEVRLADTCPATNLTTTTLAVLGTAGGDLYRVETNYFVLPTRDQGFTYDPDGNLTFDGIWVYRWDGENRLVEMAMTNVSGLLNAQRKRLQFMYDHLGRRVSKAVSSWTGSGFGSATTTRFVYDLPAGENGGWRLLAEVNGSGNFARSYTWGLDLSGTLDGAGGIGGLLLVTEHGGTLTNHFVAYDGNGNVAALVRTDGVETARYEYGPFGELIRASGPIARTNPFRWSTKFWDVESELVYYGYRYLSPTLGRWLSRDPIQEVGGINLYAAFLNNGIVGVDRFGCVPLGILDVLITDGSHDETQRYVEIKRGESLVQRFRAAANANNNFREFERGVDDANGMDITFLLTDIRVAHAALMQGLRGPRSEGRAIAALATDRHHVFPDARRFVDFFKFNNFNANGVFAKINGYMHRFGLHQPDGMGGAYNAVWDKFLKKNQGLKNNPYYIIGFGFGLFDRVTSKLELPFDGI